MCFKKKIKTADKVRKDRELIALNAKFVDTAIIGVGNNERLAEKLREVQEKIKYLTPSDKSDVMDYDKAIKKKIIELNRFLKETPVTADTDLQEYILKINMLMADRNTIL